MDWSIKNEQLEKTFTLKSFSSVVIKLNILVEICDNLNHHPDICIHGYKYATFRLFTHDKKKITEKDYVLAREIDRVFN